MSIFKISNFLLVLVAVALSVMLFGWSADDDDKGRLAKNGLREKVTSNSSGAVSSGATKGRTRGVANKNKRSGRRVDRITTPGAMFNDEAALEQWLSSDDNSPGLKYSSTAHFAARTMSLEDVEREFSYVLEIEDDLERRAAMRDLVKDAGEMMSAELAAEFLSSITDPAEQRIFVQEFVNAMMASQRTKDVVELLAMPGNETLLNGAVSYVASKWAAFDPMAAAGWANSLEDQNMAKRAYSEIALVWAKSDMQAAFGWAVSIEDQKTQNMLLGRIGKVFAIQDPAGAVQWAASFEDQRTSRYIMDYGVKRWATKDLSGVVQWAGQLEAGSQRDRYINIVAPTWAATDPAAAADWVINNASGVASRDSALAGIAAFWARKDPEAAAKWGEQISSVGARATAISKTTYTWAAKDPVGAVQWLNTLPVDRVQYQALVGVASRWTIKDPFAAANWASGVEDNATRVGVMEAVGREWIRRDPDNGKSWVRESGLPVDIKNRLLPQG